MPPVVTTHFALTHLYVVGGVQICVHSSLETPPLWATHWPWTHANVSPAGLGLGGGVGADGAGGDGVGKAGVGTLGVGLPGVGACGVGACGLGVGGGAGGALGSRQASMVCMTPLRPIISARVTVALFTCITSPVEVDTRVT
jgi:hypothetical protein